MTDFHQLPSPAPNGREIELKFLTDAAGFKSSQDWPALAAAPAGKPQRLLSRYFDTEDGELERRGIVLRVRKQGRKHLLGLKWMGDSARGGPFERGEIEAALPGPDPNPALLGPACAGMLHDIVGDRQLLPIYETDIRRTIRLVHSAAAEIEIAFDTGHLRLDHRQVPIREIELELKSGDPAELYRLGRSFAENCPVRLGMQAKAERGALLRSGRPPEVVQASTSLQGDPSVDEAIGMIINACIAHFTANFPAFETGDSEGAVHQMRVALRRLRAILKPFDRAFPCPEFLSLRDKAKEIANVLGQARNWDVLRRLIHSGPAASFPEEPGFAPILAAVEQRRIVGRDKVRQLLAAPGATCFVLSTQEFIARHGWRATVSAEALARLTAPAKEFAEAELGRLHHSLLKRGKHLASQTPHQRHKVRIGFKNIRYTADVFSGLFDPSSLRPLLRSAARLQDTLGTYNDLVTALDLLNQLELPAGQADRAAGIIVGWIRHAAIPDQDQLARDWKKFKKAKPFG
jgi:inorganic triphosphatase YgiF